MVEPTFDRVTGPFPQTIKRQDPKSGLRSIRVYYDPRSFSEAREISKGTWTHHSWGHIPRPSGTAYVADLFDYAAGKEVVLHTRRDCGGRALVAMPPPHPSAARWCRRCGGEQ